jgi:hypothetical protein
MVYAATRCGAKRALTGNGKAVSRIGKGGVAQRVSASLQPQLQNTEDSNTTIFSSTHHSPLIIDLSRSITSNMASAQDQELLPDQTEGFKVGEKKTMDEYHKLGMLVSIFVCCMAQRD